MACALGCSGGSAGGSGDPQPFRDASSEIVPTFDVPTRDVFRVDREATPEVVDLTDAQLFEDAPARDAPCVSALPVSYTFTTDGGKAVRRDTVTLAPQRRFLFERRWLSTSTSQRCETTIAACDSADTVDIGEVTDALAHPDVAGPLAMRGDHLYGNDPRPVDGVVLVIETNGARVLVGEPCRLAADASACTPIPTGIQRAVDVLNQLRDQEIRRAPCEAALAVDGG
ncbi:MAG: hypothetical protein U0325_31910 [Polyangiales bacterium]